MLYCAFFIHYILRNQRYELGKAAGINNFEREKKYQPDGQFFLEPTKERQNKKGLRRKKTF